MSPFNNTTNTNLDNLLLQTLMGRLQIRPESHSSLFPQSPEDLLLANFSSDEDDDDESGYGTHKTQLAREESKLEKDIIKVILSGDFDSLKPNSGQAVSIGEHHICVGFHDENGSSGYRVWEWHGHIMLFDEENGYTPEYVYGNYFERVRVQQGGTGRVEEKSGNLGLRELIHGGESNGERIVHRNVNSASSTTFVRF